MNYGESVTLAWTVTGAPSSLSLAASGTTQSVLGMTQFSMTPYARQTFTLSGSDGMSRSSASVTVVARGLYLVAGSPNGTPGTGDGPGASATLTGPNFLAFDSIGNLFFTEPSTNLIRMIDVAGNVSTVAGVRGMAGSADGPARSATFYTPNGVAVDAAGNLYVTDGSNQEIRQISPDGVVTTIAGSPEQVGSADGQGAAARFNIPAGIVVDTSGNLLVTDLLNHTIRRIDSLGNVTTWAGNPSAAGSSDGPIAAATFSAPDGLWFDPSGNLYVPDVGNNNLRRIDATGNVTTVARSASFNYPSNVTTDQLGNVYIADTNNYSLRKFDAQGTVTTVAGGSAGGPFPMVLPGSLNNTHGVAVSAAGDLYAISGNQIVEVVAP